MPGVVEVQEPEAEPRKQGAGAGIKFQFESIADMVDAPQLPLPLRLLRSITWGTLAAMVAYPCLAPLGPARPFGIN